MTLQALETLRMVNLTNFLLLLAQDRFDAFLCAPIHQINSSPTVAYGMGRFSNLQATPPLAVFC